MLAHRPVEKPDLARICSFLRSEEELFHAYPKAVFPLTPAQLQQAIDQRRDPTVVEHDETVVGFANFYRWEGGICCFGNVAVAPRARGRGVGQYLIRTMIGLARENHGATEGRVSCFNANVGGLLLYTKLGFEPFSVEERRAPDGRRVALIHMRGPAAETDKAVDSSAPRRLGDWAAYPFPRWSPEDRSNDG